jgi:hypothetical protein
MEFLMGIKLGMERIEKEAHDSLDLVGEVATLEPVVVEMKPAPMIRQKREAALHAVYDAKPPEVIQLEAAGMDLERWSKVVARLDTEKSVKVDANITAMGIFAMFPVAVENEK